MKKTKQSKWKQKREKRLKPKTSKKIHIFILIFFLLMISFTILTQFKLETVFQTTPKTNEQSFSLIKEIPVTKIDFNALETEK